MKWQHRLFALMSLLFSYQISFASEQNSSDAEKEAWFNDDAEFRIADVNEGKLNFLVDSKKALAHKSENHIKILPESLKNGWVEMAQCHRGLDAVPLAQLVFPEYVIRQLKITKQQGIAEAVVEGNSVQMVDLSRGAALCVAMQVKALHKESEGQYALINGPYQRRFLDGYYPMSLQLNIDYSESGIKPVDIYPVIQPGMKADDKMKKLVINASFEGVLRTRVLFSALKIVHTGTDG